jgi:prefoldin alpha subunit
MEQEELQRKIEVYRTLEDRVNSLAKQREVIVNKIVEIKTTLASLEDMEKSNSEILFPIGGEAWSVAKGLNKDKIIVEVGAGVAIEKSYAEAREILTKRATELEQVIDEVSKDIEISSEKLKQLSPEIESEIKKMNAG